MVRRDLTLAGRRRRFQAGQRGAGGREARGNCRANGLDPCILYTPLEFREAARVRGSPTEGTAEGATYRTGQVLSASITVKQRKRKMEL